MRTVGGRLEALACLFAVGLLAGSASAAADVRVSPLHDPVSTDPGDVLSLSFRVCGGPVSGPLDVEPLPPAGWPVVAPPPPPIVPPDGCQVVRLDLLVPESQPAGTVTVGLRVRRHGPDPVSAETYARVLVHSVRGIEIEMIDAPERVAAGHGWRIRVVVRNSGNGVRRLRVDATVQTTLSVDVTPSELELGARSSAVVEVAGEVDEGIARVERRAVTIRAFDEDDVVAAATVVLLKVLPSGVAAGGRYHAIPVVLGVRTMNRDLAGGGPAAQLALIGEGSLGGGDLRFELRSPGRTDDVSSLGRRDDSWISYRRPGAEMLLGDAVFELSPLLERGRFGRGAEIAAHLGPLSARGYRVENRRDAGASTGVELELALTGTAKASLLLLDDGTSRSVGLRGRVGDPSKGFADLEVAHTDGGDSGWRVQGGAVLGAVRLDGELVEGGSRFAGSAAGRSSAWLEARMEPAEGWRTSLGVSEARSPAGDGGELRSGRRRLTVEHLPTGRTRLGVVAEAWLRRDGGPAGDDLERHSAGVEAGVSEGRFGADLAVEAGTIRDRRPDGESADALSVRVFGWWRPLEEISLHATLGRRRGFFAVDERNDSASVGFTGRVSDVLIGLETLWRDDGRRRRLEPRAWLAWDTFRGQRLIMEVRRSDDGGGTAAAVEYSIPLDLPVHRRRNVGALEGRVLDPTGRGIGGVVVTTTGAAVVTGEDGRFRFPALPPGRHRVGLDLGERSLRLVSERPMPLEVMIDAGRTRRLVVRLVPARSVRGRVVRMVAADDTALASSPADGRATGVHELQPAGGMAGVTVVLDGPGGARRLPTSSDGAFCAHGLRPGPWSVRVEPSGLPRWTTSEPVRIHIAADRSDPAEVELLVVPVRRVLELQDVGAGVVLRPPP